LLKKPPAKAKGAGVVQALPLLLPPVVPLELVELVIPVVVLVPELALDEPVLLPELVLDPLEDPVDVLAAVEVVVLLAVPPLPLPATHCPPAMKATPASQPESLKPASPGSQPINVSASTAGAPLTRSKSSLPRSRR
jgi:hypothetical protein